METSLALTNTFDAKPKRLNLLSPFLLLIALPACHSPQPSIEQVEPVVPVMAIAFPESHRAAYTNKHGAEHVYLVQEPANIAPESSEAIFIYMHGNGGQEEQGMDPANAEESFARLRTLLARRK